jgi:hypothetical protein
MSTTQSGEVSPALMAIETDEREYICELIHAAAAAAGFQDEKADITYEWRDW